MITLASKGLSKEKPYRIANKERERKFHRSGQILKKEEKKILKKEEKKIAKRETKKTKRSYK